MLKFYQKSGDVHHVKRPSYQPSTLNISSKMYQSQKDKRNDYNRLYSRKTVSLDKSTLFNSMNKSSIITKSNSISANKQIQGKKIASSNYNSGTNININLTKINNTLGNAKDNSFSYLNCESK